MMKRKDTRKRQTSAIGRLTQARRLFQVAAIVAASRVGFLTVDNVAERLRDQTGETWHDRTVRRDLQMLDELGLVERSNVSTSLGRSSQVRWVGNSDSLAHVVLRSVDIDDSTTGARSESLQAFLDRLPDPWEIDAERHRVATAAARLLAMVDTDDRRFLKAELVFTLGEGWGLRHPDAGFEVSAFDRFKALPAVAESMVDEIDIDADRWELTDVEPPTDRLQQLYLAAMRDADVAKARAEECVELMGFSDDPDSIEADTAREIVYHQRTPSEARQRIAELQELLMEA